MTSAGRDAWVSLMWAIRPRPAGALPPQRPWGSEGAIAITHCADNGLECYLGRESAPVSYLADSESVHARAREASTHLQHVLCQCNAPTPPQRIPFVDIWLNIGMRSDWERFRARAGVAELWDWSHLLLQKVDTSLYYRNQERMYCNSMS